MLWECLNPRNWPILPIESFKKQQERKRSWKSTFYKIHCQVNAQKKNTSQTLSGWDTQVTPTVASLANEEEASDVMKILLVKELKPF